MKGVILAIACALIYGVLEYFKWIGLKRGDGKEIFIMVLLSIIIFLLVGALIFPFIDGIYRSINND